ncbi:MAG: Murein L,D-transpeptidase [Nitrospira sp.]|nr:MAG: Murein L,D-transpeptidase [Nitrospira sp.]
MAVVSVRSGWMALVKGLVLAGALSACVQAIPPELVSAIDRIDQQLVALKAPEVAPEEYARFVRQWVPLRARVQSDDDLVRWPWEANELETELRRLYEEGGSTLAKLHSERQTQQQRAQQNVLRVEERLRALSSHIDAIDGRIVLGGKPVQSDLLVKQARSFYDQHDYRRAMDAADLAGKALRVQSALLARELGRYADEQHIRSWQAMAQQTIDWSRTHRSTAIVISKAERMLTLYKNGHKVVSYPVRLGFNGIREKQFQGDGATPEGQYRITDKRGAGRTQFYRALVLDYPNQDDRRRFVQGKKAGRIPLAKQIGGQIEIHGVENELMAQTLGCVMLDNAQMNALFERVEQGSVVSIVGALTGRNAVAMALAQLGAHGEEI